MKKFFNKAKQLEHKHLRELAGLSAAMMILIFAAVFVAGGGMAKVNHLLAANHIISGSLTASVFPENNSANDLEALIPMQNGVQVSSVQTGTAVNWIWNAGTYGANTFNPVCEGSWNGSNYMCTVNQGSPNTNFTCPPITCPGGLQTNTDPVTGSDYTTCPSGYAYPVCGNADDINGHTSYGGSGGYPPNYISPGYDGDLTGSLTITAPSTAGDYSYYFCSNFLLHANAYNPNLTPLPCLSTILHVTNPPVTCPANGFASPWNSTSYLINPGGQGSVSNWYGRYCVHNYSASYIYIPMATAAEWNNFSAAAGSVGVGISAY